VLVLELLLIGLAITLEPVPLTAFILVLSSKGGVRKGAGFVLGWLLSLVTVVVITLLATGNSPPKANTQPSLAALAVKIAIGVALLLIAMRQRRRMNRPKKPKKTPRWQTGIDGMSPLYAAGLALFVQPWGLIAAGVATIVGAKLASWEDYLALALFCGVATGTYLAAEIYAAARPERAQGVLTELRTWMDTHTDEIIIWVSVILGLWLIGDSLYLILS
jgi:threonine/homoserine/homoserine lactone efflux protein